MIEKSNFFYHATDKLIKLYDDLTQYILDDIVERILKSSVITIATEYKIWKLQQLGVHSDKIIEYIKKITKLSDIEINKIFLSAGLFFYKYTTDEIFKKYNNENKNLKTSKLVKDVFNYYVKVTKGTVHNLTRTTTLSTQKLLIDKLDQVHFRVVSGVQSYSEAINEAVKEIGKSDLKVRYSSGHQDNLDVAVRRAVVTGVNKCYADLNLIRAKENGYNYVLVSSHLGARHIENPSPEYLSHDIWQGKVYKVNWNNTLPKILKGEM